MRPRGLDGEVPGDGRAGVAEEGLLALDTAGEAAEAERACEGDLEATTTPPDLLEGVRGDTTLEGSTTFTSSSTLLSHISSKAATARSTGSRRTSDSETKSEARTLEKHPRICLSIKYTLRDLLSTTRASIHSLCVPDQYETTSPTAYCCALVDSAALLPTAGAALLPSTGAAALRSPSAPSVGVSSPGSPAVATVLAGDPAFSFSGFIGLLTNTLTFSSSSSSTIMPLSSEGALKNWLRLPESESTAAWEMESSGICSSSAGEMPQA
mmetsp:Transcript_122344/g.273317  ORF Transcript_122344/g.273317 Transcript_122344/m.273317 type:complete len:268 (-) Transcript_122344:155-958(-)